MKKRVSSFVPTREEVAKMQAHDDFMNNWSDLIGIVVQFFGIAFFMYLFYYFVTCRF